MKIKQYKWFFKFNFASDYMFDEIIRPLFVCMMLIEILKNVGSDNLLEILCILLGIFIFPIFLFYDIIFFIPKVLWSIELK